MTVDGTDHTTRRCRSLAVIADDLARVERHAKGLSDRVAAGDTAAAATLTQLTEERAALTEELSVQRNWNVMANGLSLS